MSSHMNADDGAAVAGDVIAGVIAGAGVALLTQ